jgi:hypothetical protein
VVSGLGDERPVEIINFIDDHSRAVLASIAVPVATAAEVVRIFFATAAIYGLRQSVLTDNGAIYTAAYLGSHSGMEIELATLGIAFKHGKPYHPQTQGKVERYHLTLKKWLRKRPAAASLVELQAQIDRFVHIYNEERPHTARECPPMPAWRALDKVCVEIDGRRFWLTPRFAETASTRPAASRCATDPGSTTSGLAENTAASASSS